MVRTVLLFILNFMRREKQLIFMLLPVVLAAVFGMMTEHLTKSFRGRKDFLEHTVVRAPPVDGSGSRKEHEYQRGYRENRS